MLVNNKDIDIHIDRTPREKKSKPATTNKISTGSMGTSVKKCSIKKQSMNDHLQHVYKEEKCVCEVYLKKQTIENI